MNDEGRAQVSALFDAVRAIDPPPGARERVRERVEQGVAARSARSRGIRSPAAQGSSAARGRLAAVAVGATLGVVLVWTLPPLGGRRLQVLVAQGARVGTAALRPGQPIGRQELVELEAGGRLEVAVGSARVTARSGARLRLSERALTVEAGVVEVRGRLRVEGPSCTIEIDGRGEVTRSARGVQVAMWQGRAQPAFTSAACQVVEAEPQAAAAPTATPPALRPGAAAAAARREGPAQAQAAPPPVAVVSSLAPPTAPRPARRSGPAAQPEPPVTATQVPAASPVPPAAEPTQPAGESPPAASPSAVSPPPSGPPGSELAVQLEAWRAAEALARRDDAAALERWQDLVRRWPEGPLAPEVDLRIIETLLRLGRQDQARAAARAFVARHPDSPRVAELRRLAEAVPE
jgi:hypothetical protein